MDETADLINANNSIHVNSSQVDMHTRENNIVNKVRCEVDNLMTSVETRVQDAVLTAMENLVNPRVELAMKSVNASSGRGVSNVVMDPDRKAFSGIIENLQRTASSRINSHTDLNRFDETRSNITKEGSDLSVIEKNMHRPTHTYHIQVY